MVLALARWLNLLVHIVRHVVIMFRRSWGPSPTRDNLYRHKTERVHGDLTSYIHRKKARGVQAARTSQ